MRKVTYGGACSLDGFIARADHGMDWLYWSDDVSAITAGFWATVDTVIMGRKTYEISLRSGGGAQGDTGMKGYVASRTLKQCPDGRTEIISDAVTFLRALKERPGKGICVMGGGDLARSLLEAGLIDEIGLNIHPVVLGSGIPAFPGPTRQIDLELVACQPLAGGCVLVTYRVKR
jgi:dihydrofolate reductase